VKVNQLGVIGALDDFFCRIAMNSYSGRPEEMLQRSNGAIQAASSLRRRRFKKEQVHFFAAST
jgi:hypothetical protein